MSGGQEQEDQRENQQGYRFGDFTRGIFQKLSEVNFKETSGRGDGSKGYQFGDVTRSLLRTVVGGGGIGGGGGAAADSPARVEPSVPPLHQSTLRTFILKTLKTSQVLTDSLPSLRKAAIYQSVTFCHNDEEITQLLLDCLGGSPYLSPENKARLSELALSGTKIVHVLDM